MATSYKWVDWEFDTDKWAEVTGAVVSELGREYLAELMEITPAAIDAWHMQRYKGEFRYPNMTNLIKLSNIANVSPGVFWRLKE